MANRIKGITIEIDGNTTPLQKSLKDVDSSLKNTQTQLKDVEKLLKLDPALMAGPLITTLVDTISLIIYFALTRALIPMG